MRHTLSHAYTTPVWASLLVVTAVYAACWVASQSKLIYTDEIWFAHDASQILSSAWNQLVIPHPPLYVALGAMFSTLAGDVISGMRLLGGLSFLATLYLIPLAVHAIAPAPQHAQTASLIAVAGWGVHPLAMQGSLLLDIDNTLLPPAMLTFLIALRLSEGQPLVKRIIAIAPTVTLMLWIKWLPSTLLLMALAILLSLLRRRDVLSTLAAIAVGAVTFLVSFALFVAVSGFPLETLAPTLARTQEPVRGGLQRLISRIVMGGGITTVWLGVPLVVAFGWFTFRRLRALAQHSALQFSDLPLSFALTGMALYSAGNELPMGFPRYHYPVALCVVLLMSTWLAEQPFLRARQWQAGVLISAATLAAYFALAIPDPLLPQYELTFTTNDLRTRLMFGLQLQVRTLLIPLVLAGTLDWLILRRQREALVAVGVAFCLASWLVLDVAQATADYATIYEYGRRGGREMGAWIQSNTHHTDRIIAPNEIIFAANRQGTFVVPMLACSECDVEHFLTHLRADQPVAIVMTTKEDGRYTQVTRHPDFIRVQRECYPQEKRIGSYIAYLRSSETPCSL